MPIGSGSDVRIAFINEVTYGTTPATPTFTVMRTTSGGLSTSKVTVKSEEIRQDQNVIDLIQTGQDVTGSYPIELSYGSFDTLIEAVLGGTWTTNVLKNGVTVRSFTFEEMIELGATDTFRRFTGCMVNSMSLAFSAREKVTGAFGVMGRQEALATAIIAGATYPAAGVNPVMSASGSIGSLTIGALNPQPKIRSMSLEINRGLRTRPIVGSLYTEQHGFGMCDVTGEIEAYFESNAFYQEVLNHTAPAISLTIGETTLQKYTILLPRVRFGNGQVVTPGQSQDVMARISFQAVFDTTTAASIQITRAVV